MKNVLLFIGIFCLLNFEVKSQNQVDTTVIYRIDSVEEMPEFPGGIKALSDLINNNLIYPKLASKYKAEGKVLIAFTLLRTGELVNFKVLKSSYTPIENEDSDRKLAFESLDNEALRIIKLSPNWYPAKINGIPVKIGKMTIPIQFTLQ